MPNEDIPTLAPIGGQPAAPTPPSYPTAPQPTLLSGSRPVSTQVPAQPWATARRVFPITISPGRVTNRTAPSDFRTGEVVFEGERVTIQGKAVLSSSIRIPILVVGVLLRFGWIIAYLITEYAIRIDRTDAFALNDIETIVLEPEKERACIAYHLPDKPKVAYALGLKLPGGLYTEFSRTVREALPERVHTGKILPVTPPWVWWTFGAILVIAVVAIVIISLKH